MKLMQKSLLATLLLAGVIGTANAASVTYDYLGNDFNIFQTFDPLQGGGIITNTLPSKVGPRITGSATFADGIDNQVTSYMLTDGLNTFDNTTAANPGFNMTFINNNVNTWTISLINDESFQGLEFIYTQLFTQGGEDTAQDQSFFYKEVNGVVLIRDFASNNRLGGSWSLRQEQVSEVPVPAALPLMASALGLFGLARSRKQSV